MNFLEIDIADHIELLSSEKIRELQLLDESRILFSTTAGLNIIGVHILPPVDFEHTFFLGSPHIALGKSYQAWFDDHANSKENATATKRALAKCGLTLARFGDEALNVGYVYGPHVYQRSIKSPPTISFPIPVNAKEIARDTIATMMDYLHEALIPEEPREKLEYELVAPLLKNSDLNLGFGLDEKMMSDIFFSSDAMRLTKAIVDLEASLAAINIALESADNNPTQWLKICQSVAKYGDYMTWPYFSSRIDSQLVEKVIIGRLNLLARMQSPQFYIQLFSRTVSTLVEVPSSLDTLKWVLRAKPDVLLKAELILKEYKSCMNSRYPWCGIDYFKGVVPDIAIGSYVTDNGIKL
jgi:hypothetical protein